MLTATQVYPPFDLRQALNGGDEPERSVRWSPKSEQTAISAKHSPSLLDANARYELETLRSLRRLAAEDWKRRKLWRAAAWITSEEERRKFVQLVEGDATAARRWWNKLGPRERERRRANACAAHQERREWAILEAERRSRTNKLAFHRAMHLLLTEIMRDARGDADAADFLQCEIHLLLGDLIARAQADNLSAIKAMARVAIRATDAVAELTRRAKQNEPNLLVPLQAVASVSRGWPLPIFADQGRDAAMQEREDVLETLKVGQSTLAAPHPGRRFKSDDAIGRVAVKLWEYIRDAGAFHVAMNNGRGALMAGKITLPIWMSEAAELTTFTKDNATAWWTLAKQVLRNACKDPAEFPDLNRRIPISKKRTVGRRRNFIETELERRFVSLAPKQR